MKVLIVADKDWAGLGETLKKSLRKVGVDARFYSRVKNINKHKTRLLTKEEAIAFSHECDIVQFMHSVILPYINIKDKKVVVFHGGSRYRFLTDEICKIFNPIVDCTIIQTYDLFGHGGKNEKWLLPPVNTDAIKPVYDTKGDHIIVGHYPSGIKKGSEHILRIINKIKDKVPKFEYRYSGDKVTWVEQLKRMSEVDIYIERMNMFRYSEKRKKKRRTGVWGVTALEAACLGKVVVTNFYGREVYEKEYGECALQSANSEEEMETILINLLSKPKSELMELKKKTRLWVEEYHTFEKVGMKLRRIYEEL